MNDGIATPSSISDSLIPTPTDDNLTFPVLSETDLHNRLLMEIVGVFYGGKTRLE